MDNKIILELVAKNLEEIKLLVEALRKGEKADPLLIEITATKAKTLYQELMLLSPDEPEITEKDEITSSKETSVSENEIEVVALTECEIEPQEILVTEDEIEDIAQQESIIENAPLPSHEIKSVKIEPSEKPVNDTETELQIKTTYDELIINEVEPVIVKNSESIHEEKCDESKTEIQEKKILGEKFVNEPSVYEKLAASSVYESKVKGKPVTNIISAIGLNDRFLYIRELFGNDSKSFEYAVDQLDRFNNFIEAIDYLEKNFQWTKNEASLKFMELVKRRFEK